VILPGYADADTLQARDTRGGRHLVSRPKRHSQRHDDETESPSESFVERLRLPASARVLIGASEPQQIRLIDPASTQGSSHLTPPLSGRLGGFQMRHPCRVPPRTA